MIQLWIILIYKHTYVCIYMYIYIYTHPHTYKHAYIHTYKFQVQECNGTKVRNLDHLVELIEEG